MRLAVRKEAGSIPGSGYHYMLLPIRLDGPDATGNADILAMTGHTIINVEDHVGRRLLKQSARALAHQVEVAHLTERAIAKAASKS